MYKGYNLFIDYSYYSELFFKNNKFKKDKALSLYFEFLDRFIRDPRFISNEYTRKTVFIPVFGWDIEKGTPVHDHTKNLNPMSMIVLISTDGITFTKFLTAVAARTGEMLNYANIASEVGVSVPTIKNWISVLERTGIVFLLQPYSSSALKRAIKTPKIYFRDTGLACYLTRWLTSDALTFPLCLLGIVPSIARCEKFDKCRWSVSSLRVPPQDPAGADDRLVDAGNTVIVIEHNLDLIKCADHIIDLGPEGGSAGGLIVAEGTPEEVAAVPESFTGQYLKPLLEKDKALRAAEAQK